MKTIVDNDFPPLDHPMCLAMRLELYKRKRQYSYKELKDGSIYIYFPRVNPIRWVYQHIKYYIWKRIHTKGEEVVDEDN